MALDDSFSIRLKKSNGKWYWSHNCIGEVLTSDYYGIKDLVNKLRYNYPVVCIYNNSQSHLSEIYIYGKCEILRKEVGNNYAKFK